MCQPANICHKAQNTLSFEVDFKGNRITFAGKRSQNSRKLQFVPHDKAGGEQGGRHGWTKSNGRPSGN